MKKLIVLSFFVFSLVGCASYKVQMQNPKKVASYQESLQNYKSCKTDADCVAISKGCCPCDGQEAVNKKYVESLNKKRLNACGVGPCTLQMCYTDINVSCVNKVCAGTPKEISYYSVR